MDNKNAEQKKSAPEINGTAENKKAAFYAHPAFIAAALILAVVLVFFIIIAIVSSTQGMTIAEIFGIGQERLDYKNDPLDSYINIKEEDYKGYEIKLDVLKPTDSDVESHIMNLIYKNINQKEDVLNGGAYLFNQSIKVGDRLLFFYAGYEIDENGKRIEIPSLTNYANGDENGYYSENTEPLKLFIGQNYNEFPTGFEAALIGLETIKKEQGNKSNTFSARFSGKVNEGEVVYLCISYIDEYGIFHDSENVRIDLADENTEAEWGEYFFDFLYEYYIGRTADISGFEKQETAKGIRFYTDLKINYTTTCETEENIKTIKITYPHDWDDETLRGKTVYFDLFLEKTVEYQTKEFNDAFVTDVLGMKAEDLENYEGDTLADKYKAYYFEELMEEYEQTCQVRAEELLWERLRENIEFTAVPEYEYKISHSIQYNAYKAEYIELSQGDNSYYDDLDGFIADSLGVESQDAGDALRAAVKDAIYEKLVIFSILRAENLLPKTDEEFKVIYDNELRLDYEYYLAGCEQRGEDPEYKTIDEYDVFINEYYGKEMYEDFVYYNYLTSKILNEMVTIVY